MMKKLSLLLLLQLLLTFNFHAQDLDLKWSSRTTYSNAKDGFFESFVGSSDKFVYGIYKDFESRLLRRNRNKFEMHLVAFDKQNMQQSYIVGLKSKKDKDRLRKMKEFTYVSTIVIENEVYVFWKKSTLTQTDIYAEEFDAYLNRLTKLKKVYSVKHPTSKKRVAKRKRRKRNNVGNLAGIPIVIQAAKDGSTNLMIGAELYKGKDEPVEFDYAIIDTKFDEISKGHVTLPAIQVSKYMNSSVFSFDYGKDGNIYIKGYVRLSKEESKAAKKGEYTAYALLCVVDPATSEMEPYTMKYDGMNVFNFDLLTDENGVKLYGFFNDISKDPTGRNTHGIFYATLKDGELSDPAFTYFDAETLNELFREDPSDNKEQTEAGKKKKQRKKKKKKQEKAMDDEALDESYVIETAKAVDNENIVLFCTKVYNYTTVTCTSSGTTGGQTCVVNYYCRKSNVTAFKLDNRGEIVWASNIDREKTFSGWNVKDLRIIHDKEKFYVIYGSAYHTDAKKRSGKRAKKKKEVRDQFEYAVFDYETGEAKKTEYVVNDPKVEKKERKYISPRDIQVFDNQYFVNSITIKLKPSYIIGSFALFAAPFAIGTTIFPVLFVPTLLGAWPSIGFLAIKGHIYKGAGHMGTIKLPEEDPSRKKK